MNAKVKLGAYVVLIALTAWFGHGFYSRFHAGGAQPATTVHHHKKKKKPVEVAASTNNPAATNLAAATNAADQSTNATDQTTNSVATDQNGATNGPVAQSANTNGATPATATAPITAGQEDDEPTSTDYDVISGGPQGTTITYLALFVLSAIGLGLLITYDLTHAVGSKAGEYLFADVAEGQRDPEYEKAEQAWADGNHLEAIQMLRDFYKRNPREVHAALRIAEIYEKDLRNYVAAALEYEEVLKKKLPSERWGRAAVHLCNLYSRLGEQDKMMALLRRIASEYPQTAAARKARERLGLPEPEEAPTPDSSTEGENEEQAYDVATNKGEWLEENPEQAPPQSEEPKPNLPPGFRPKK